MNDLPKNDVLKNLKQQFLNGNLVEYDHKYDKTVASWEKSRADGADAHAVRLGEDCRDLHVFDRIDDISKSNTSHISATTMKAAARHLSVWAERCFILIRSLLRSTKAAVPRF